VNGGGPPASGYNAQQPPHFASAFAPPAAYGTSAAGFFTSEYGVGQPASFEIMAPTLSPTFWSMHGGNHSADSCSGGFAHVCTGGNVMAQRNYACDDALQTYFGGSLLFTLDDFGAEAFQQQLYVCQLATALALKATTEEHRSRNMIGLMTWQLGEVWPTDGWGSLEYASGDGSILGGRWKPSHYVLAAAFANTLVACDDTAACFVRSDDALAPLAAEVVFSVTRLADGSTAELARAPVSLPRGAASVGWFCAGGDSHPCTAWPALLPASGCASSGADCALTASVTDASSGLVLATNTIFLTTPARLNLSRAVRVTFSVGEEDADGSVPVTLTAAGAGAAPALHVTLFTLANGRFSANFIPLLSGSTVVSFIPFAPGQRNVLADSLRVNAVNELLRPPPPPRPSNGTCTTHTDTDASGAGVTAPGNSIGDCCTACWANAQCTAAAYNPALPGTCWLKFGGPSVPRAGILLCTIDFPPDVVVRVAP